MNASDAQDDLLHPLSEVSSEPEDPPQEERAAEASQIKLKDLLQTSPLEDEAEYYLQQTLEEVIPDGINITDAVKILDIPKDAEKEFFGRQDEVIPNTSTDAKLWKLAAEMDRMQMGVDDAKATFGLTESSASIDTVALSDADRLIQNAADLTDQGSTEIGSGEAPAAEITSPAARWTKVKASAVVIGTMGKKRADEEVAVHLSTLSNEDDYNSMSSYSGESHAALGNFFKVGAAVKSDFHDFDAWVRLKQQKAFQFAKVVLLYVMIPSTILSAALFYWADNPPCGAAGEACRVRIATAASGRESVDTIVEFFRGNRASRTSASYWILFLFVRQVVTFCCARLTQAFIVDFVCLRTRFASNVLGPYVTLWTVQSKGWPFLITWWAFFDFALLYGDHGFAKHWLYWQDKIGLFNSENPSGSLTSDSSYFTILAVMIGVGVAATAKRWWVGIFLGKQTFQNYAAKLRAVMESAILIGHVATLGREIKRSKSRHKLLRAHDDIIARARSSVEDTVSERATSSSAYGNPSVRSMATNLGTVSESSRVAIAEALGAWEEPQSEVSDEDIVDIGAIIQFRRSLSCLNASFPFSVAFGRADTRERCVARAEKLFRRLRESGNSKGPLDFDVIALVAINRDGSLDEDKLMKLVSVFRPGRDGQLSLLEFAKSIDSVYKEIRLLRAAVSSTARMDKAFERAINMAFSLVVGCSVLYAMGVDPFVLFTSFSSFILAFSFAIAPAASKYFEGLLMVLVRQPYSVGDRVHLSGVESDCSFSGSPTWIVKDVSLFATTMLFAATNEVATYTNSALANSRIINAARSPQALLHILMKFPIDAPYGKMQVYQQSMEHFIRNRPREWLSFAAFRQTRVEADSGFVEYIIVAQHRESWQQVGALLTSKAELTSFALEVAKQMGIQYHAPPRPVDLRMVRENSSAPQAAADESSSTERAYDFSGLHDMFAAKKL